MSRPPPDVLPDVLRDGVCCRGRHAIRCAAQTITYPDNPGRFCRACSVEMDDERAGIDSWRPHDDAGYVDEIAVAEAISGQRQQRMQLRPHEMDQAVLRLRVKGFTAPRIAQRLFISETDVWLTLRRCEGRLDATG